MTIPATASPVATAPAMVARRALEPRFDLSQFQPPLVTFFVRPCFFSPCASDMTALSSWRPDTTGRNFQSSGVDERPGQNPVLLGRGVVGNGHDAGQVHGV